MESTIRHDHELYNHTAKSVTNLTPELYHYLLGTSLREPSILEELRQETTELRHQIMQISPDQAQFMMMLIQIANVKTIIEIGTFTGDSATAMALALPKDGKITACDVCKDWTDIAQKYWEKTGVAHKIDLHLRPANDTLDDLLENHKENTFDMAFIDADKANQDSYYEKTLKLIKPNGLILIDNALWFGAVIDPLKDNDEDTLAIRNLNAKIKNDDRVDISLLGIGDGLFLVRKK